MAISFLHAAFFEIKEMLTVISLVWMYIHYILKSPEELKSLKALNFWRHYQPLMTSYELNNLISVVTSFLHEWYCLHWSALAEILRFPHLTIQHLPLWRFLIPFLTSSIFSIYADLVHANVREMWKRHQDQIIIVGMNPIEDFELMPSLSSFDDVIWDSYFDFGYTWMIII